MMATEAEAMRRAMMLAIGAALLAACASGPSKSRTATPAVTETGGAVTPAATSAVTPVPTTAEDAGMEQTVRACMTPALPDDTAGAESRLDACLNRGEAGFVVAPVGGPLPVVLIERPGDPGMCRSVDFIAWRTGGEWRLQFATPLLPDPIDDRLLGPATFPGNARVPAAMLARVVSDAGSTLMTVLSSTATCGSGPRMYPLLVALKGDAWQLAWDPRGSELTTLSDSRTDFVDASGIDHVHVRGALWGSADPAGTIFAESHPGPHRYVDQTWTRDGQRYVLSASQVEPSAYNTLVNFVYRLSIGDEAGAAKPLADPSLIDAAKRLGLIQQPLGRRWTINPDPDAWVRGPIHILSGPEWNGGPPQPVVVTFEQREGHWLISGIAPG